MASSRQRFYLVLENAPGGSPYNCLHGEPRGRSTEHTIVIAMLFKLRKKVACQNRYALVHPRIKQHVERQREQGLGFSNPSMEMLLVFAKLFCFHLFMYILMQAWKCAFTSKGVLSI